MSKPDRRRHAACRASGFTLLEVLVVIVIIGIITSMAMVSVNVPGRDNEMDEEARRLMAVLTQAREDAMLEGRDVGLRVDARSYDFAHYDARMERWELAADDPLLRERTLPDGLELDLWLENRSVKLADRTEPTDRSPLQPQVVVMAIRRPRPVRDPTEPRGHRRSARAGRHGRRQAPPTGRPTSNGD